MNDLDVRTAVRDAGCTIDDEARARVRDAVRAELAGADLALRQGGRARPPAPRRWWTVGLVTAAAAVSVAVLVARDGPPARVVPGATPSIDTSDGPVDPAEQQYRDLLDLDRLRQHRWVLTAVDGAIPGHASLAWVEFGTARHFVSGFDGCNGYAGEQGTVSVGRLMVSGIEQELVACEGGPWIQVADGDSISFTADGVLSLRRAGQELTFVPLDLLPPATLDGTYVTNDGRAMALSVDAGAGELRLGSCTTSVSATSTGLMVEPFSPTTERCQLRAPVVPVPVDAALVRLLSAPARLRAANLADGTVIVSTDDPDLPTIRLWRADTVPDAATTTLPPRSSGLAEWVDAQIDAGLTEAFVVTGRGTDARLVATRRPNSPSTGDARLVLGDGAVVELPAGLSNDRLPQLARLGGRVALLSAGPLSVDVWVLDSTHTWAPGPDLGLDIPPGRSFWTGDLGGFLVVATGSSTVRDDGISVPVDQHGALVDPSGAVHTMATPPEGVFMRFSSTIDRYGLVLGFDNGAGLHEPLTQPWRFDAASNSWSPVAMPPWLTCAGSCEWSAPHEFGDVHLEVVTDHGLVKRLPDGSIGLYDPATDAWRRLDPSPVVLAAPQTAALEGGLLLVAPQRPHDSIDPRGTVAVLDVRDGTWTPHVLTEAVPADQFAIWEARSTGSAAMLRLLDAAGDAADDEPSPEPDFVFDANTRSWRNATSDDVEVWQALETASSVVDIRSLVP